MSMKEYAELHRGNSQLLKAVKEGFDFDLSENRLSIPGFNPQILSKDQVAGFVLLGVYNLISRTKPDTLRAHIADGLVGSPAGDDSAVQAGSGEPDWGIPESISDLSLDEITQTIGEGPFSLKLSTKDIYLSGKLAELPKKDQENLKEVIDSYAGKIAIKKLCFEFFGTSDVRVVSGESTENFKVVITLPIAKLGTVIPKVLASKEEGFEMGSMTTLDSKTTEFILIRRGA